jgi:diguanylate cyclase
MANLSQHSETPPPAEIARETLRRLALKRMPPTPENYRVFYHEVAGLPVNDEEIPVLFDLANDLSVQYPGLARTVTELDKAIRQENWKQCSKRFGDVISQLHKPSLDSSANSLHTQAENILLLKELLAKTLEQGVISHLTHDLVLTKGAQKLTADIRLANDTRSLKKVSDGLRNLWTDIEIRSSSSIDQQEALKRILLLLVENIGELLDDDTWLRGQLDLVQKSITGPVMPHTLQETERRLKEVIFKQGLVKHGLKEATTTLKTTMKTFVKRLGTAVDEAGDYQEKISGYAERINGTKDVTELNRIVDNILQDTRTTQANTQRTHDALMHERRAAEMADERIRELETKLTKMSALVREDPMTHSLNRRGMDDELARETARADRNGTSFCVAVIDIDNFKNLNDTHGHQAGDEALIHLVRIAKEELRVTDHVARMGGEEFLLMLPNTPVDEAVKVVERLQRALTKKIFMNNNDRILITFSAGVALRKPDEMQDALIARADAAMYEAKQTGKNRVCIAG